MENKPKKNKWTKADPRLVWEQRRREREKKARLRGVRQSRKKRL